jgi:hypothetical protein
MQSFQFVDSPAGFFRDFIVGLTHKIESNDKLHFFFPQTLYRPANFQINFIIGIGITCDSVKKFSNLGRVKTQFDNPVLVNKSIMRHCGAPFFDSQDNRIGAPLAIT